MTRTPDTLRPRGRGWSLPFALAVVLALVALWRLAPRAGPDGGRGAGEPASGQFASVELDVGEGPTLSVLVQWESGTALGLLEAAGRMDPALKPSAVGEGEMAMVTSIGGRESEGADGRNWLFEVNGELSKVGAGAAQVRAGDHVLWKFVPAE